MRENDIQTENLNLKICKVCKVEKGLSEFYKYNYKKFMSVCKECRKIQLQNYRKNNKEYYKQQSKNRYEQNKLRAIEYKGGCCQDCRGIFPSYVYDFHHIDPKEKDHKWTLGRSWEWLKEELDKCLLLCANCHRIRHWDNKNELE